MSLTDRIGPSAVHQTVEDAVDFADKLRTAYADDGDMANLARLLAEVRDAQRLLAMVERECDADLAKLVTAGDEREPEIPGVGTLKVYRRGKRTEWDSSRLFAKTLRLATDRAASMPSPDTGAYPDPASVAEVEAAVLDVLGACLPLTKSLGWRTTGLKECGIDPDEYRSTEAGTLAVRIVSES